MKRLSVVFIAFLFLFNLSFCFLKAQNPAFKNYTTADGLPSNNIYSVLQDEDGFMWFATDNGVSRFDGASFKNFSMADGLSDNNVLDITRDAERRLWFLTFNGKISFYLNGKIYNSTNSSLLQKLDFNKNILVIFQDSKKNLWFSSGEKGLACLLPSGEILMFKDILTRFIFEDKNGNVKLITDKGDICSLSTKGVSLLYPSNRNDIGQGVMLPGDTSMLISGTRDVTSLFTYFLKTNKFVENNFKQYGSSNIHHISTDNKKNVWVSTLTGAYQFQNGIVSPEKERIFFRKRSISSVLQDRDGGFWFSTLGEGVIWVPSIYNRVFDAQAGLVENTINSIVCLPNGSIMTGSLNGSIQKIVNDSVIGKNQSLISPVGPVLKIDKDKNGDTYIVTTVAVLKYNRGKFSKMPDDGRSTFYKTIYIAPDDTPWIGNGFGIKKIVGNGIETIYENNVVDRVYSIAQIKSNELWLGTYNGLFLFKKGKMIRQGNKYPILSSKINALAFSSDSTLWIATSDYGLVKISKGRITTYTNKDYLLSNRCNSLLCEGNKIYVATDKGLNVVTEENNAINFASYSPTNGLLVNNINQVIRKAQDVLLLATDKGVIEFKEHTLPDVMSGSPYIKNIEVNDSSKLSGERFRFHYNQNNIQVDFGAINFYAAGNITYAYKLAGIDSEWNYTTSSSVKYARLAPGNYKFLLKVRNSIGDVGTKTASLNFFIETPWWLTIWFKAAALIGIIVFAVVVIKWRFNAYRKKVNLERLAVESELKALRAQINPHFIYNSLNSIQDFIMHNQKEDANLYLSKFATLMRNILNHSRSSAITLTEEIESLRLYLELESIVSEGQFTFYIGKDEYINADEVEIPSMILQPYVENAILHGLSPIESGGKINISFGKQNNFLVCTVEDNGVGRRKAAELKQKRIKLSHPSLGMQVTRERIEQMSLHGKGKIILEVTDLENEYGDPLGTRVTISFPFITNV